MDNRNYLLSKSKTTNEIVYIDYNKLDGYRLKPKNNTIYDGIIVNKVIIVKPSLIEKLLKKKVKRKLDMYLQFIVNSIDDNDADDTPLRNALNELTRYKSIVENNYRKYLDEKYISLLLKKIALLEHEIKMRMVYARQPKQVEEKEIEGKRR